MAPETPPRRTRRSFDEGFKAQAVRLVLDEGKSVGAVARDLDLTLLQRPGEKTLEGLWVNVSTSGKLRTTPPSHVEI